MRRKLTLPVEPPVAMITALRARMLSACPVVLDRDAGDAAGVRRLAVERGHPVFEQNLDAGLSRRGLQRTHQAGAGRSFAIVGRGRLAGMHHRPVLDRDLHGAQREAPISWPTLFGLRSMTLTPCASSHSKVGTLLSAKARTISRSL